MLHSIRKPVLSPGMSWQNKVFTSMVVYCYGGQGLITQLFQSDLQKVSGFMAGKLQKPSALLIFLFMVCKVHTYICTSITEYWGLHVQEVTMI